MTALAPQAAPEILRRIVERRREALARGAPSSVSERHSETRPAALRTAGDNRFLAALAARRGAAVIAEIKMGSPRLGSLVQRVNPERQAAAYVRGGASALSVVVEPDFFFGSYELLTRGATASGLPVLAKDFVVDARQIEWAHHAGASAVLLLASILSVEELRGFAALARSLGLVPLIETHDREDLAKLTGAEWELVGINNRDLRTFAVDLEQSIRRLPEIPYGAARVAESGIRSRADLDRLALAGFDAFLVGESLLLADDPEAKLRELTA